MNTTAKTPWWKDDPDKAAPVLWGHVRNLAQSPHRLDRLRQMSILTDMVERELDTMAGGSGVDRAGRGVTESGAGVSDGRGGSFRANSRLNLMRSLLETVKARVLVDERAVEVAPYNARYEPTLQAADMTQALNGVLNTPHHQQQLELPVQVGILTGFGAVYPRVSADGDVTYEHVRYRDLYWDPVDGQDGRPRSLHMWKLRSRSELVAEARSWIFDDDAAREDLLEKLEKLEPASLNAVTGEQGNTAWTWYQRAIHGNQGENPYETELVHVFYSWHLPGGPKAEDGRYMISAHGGGSGDGQHVLMHSGPWTLPRFPIAMWSPMPAFEGVEGQGIGQTLYSFQELLDRAWARVQETLGTLGKTDVLVPPGFEHKRKVASPRSNFIPTEGAGGMDKPVVVPANPLGQQPLQHPEALWEQASRVIGINEASTVGGSRLGANASGVALMQEDERQNNRLGLYISRKDGFIRDIGERVLDALEIAAKRYKGFRLRYFAGRSMGAIEWGSARLPRSDYALVLQPVNALGRSKAGRLQMAIELMDRGALPGDVVNSELAGNPDVGRIQQEANAARDLIKWQLANLARPGKGAEEYSKYNPLSNGITDPVLAERLALAEIQIAIRLDAKQETVDRLMTYLAMARKLLPPPTAPAMPVDPGVGAASAAPPMDAMPPGMPLA